MTTPEAVETTAIEKVRAEVIPESHPLLVEAKELKIVDAASSDRARDMGLECKSRMKKIDDRMEDMIRNSDKVHKDLCSLRREAKDPYEQTIRILDKGIIARDDKLEREAAEKQRKADAKERARLEAEKEKELDAALEKGDEDLAEEIVNEAPATPKIAKLPTLETRGGGQKIPTTYVATLDNVKLACRSVADGKIPPKCVGFKQGEMDKLARQWEGRNAPPGISFHKKKSVSRGGRG